MTVSELVAALQGQSQDAQVAISSGGNTFDDVNVSVEADKVVLRSSSDTAVGGQSQTQA